MTAGLSTYTADGRATQLSNPRTASGKPLRCPECDRYSHPPATSCAREIEARRAA